MIQWEKLNKMIEIKDLSSVNKMLNNLSQSKQHQINKWNKKKFVTNEKDNSQVMKKAIQLETPQLIQIKDNLRNKTIIQHMINTTPKMMSLLVTDSTFKTTTM
jgi:hypothetical protein